MFDVFCYRISVFSCLCSLFELQAQLFKHGKREDCLPYGKFVIAWVQFFKPLQQKRERKINLVTSGSVRNKIHSDKAGKWGQQKQKWQWGRSRCHQGMLCWSSTSEGLAGGHTGHCCDTGAEPRTDKLLDLGNIWNSVEHKLVLYILLLGVLQRLFKF